MGRHVLDTTPAVLAYDLAREEWGSWYGGGMSWDITEKRLAIEALLAPASRHPEQARHTTQDALNSIMDEAKLEGINH